MLGYIDIQKQFIFVRRPTNVSASSASTAATFYHTGEFRFCSTNLAMDFFVESGLWKRQ